MDIGGGVILAHCVFSRNPGIYIEKDIERIEQVIEQYVHFTREENIMEFWSSKIKIFYVCNNKDVYSKYNLHIYVDL